MNEALLVAHFDDLQTAHDAAQAVVTDMRRSGLDQTSPEYEAATDAAAKAAKAMNDERVYWRQIGEVVELGHPGSRDPMRIVKSTNNDGSTPNYGGSTPSRADLVRDGLSDTWTGPVADEDGSI